MSIPGSSSALFLAAAAAGAGGYQVERSLRFNSSDSAFLSRAVPTAGNRKTWTLSLWVKRGTLTDGALFHAPTTTSGTAHTWCNFTGDTLQIYDYTGSSFNFLRQTTQVFRDPSAWYHLVFSVDSDNATAANRARIYVNGSEVTTWASTSTAAAGFSTAWNNNVTHQISSQSQYFNGYLADIYFIDGQALTPSSFTEVSATTGQLIPKAYTGTFGTNGFWLKFSDNSNNTAATLGKDYSPNGNNWTPFNLQTTTGGPTSVAAASGALPIYNTTDTYGATKGSGTRTDSNSSSIVLAIPMDGANNGTTFTDESATIKGSGSAKSITRNGDTKTSTAQSQFYGSSGYFDGTGDYLSLADSTDFAFGSGDFCVEAWVYYTGSSSVEASIASKNNSALSTAGWEWGLKRSSGNRFSFTIGNGSAEVTLNSATTPAGSRWYHVAAVRNGSSLDLYVDGIREATTSISITALDGSSELAVGRMGAYNGNYWTGYIQDLRVYKGVAKYTSNFNPPNSTQNATVAAGNDSLVDTPTSYGEDDGLGGSVRGNYATLNPLKQNSNLTITNGSLEQKGASNGQHQSSTGTFGMSSGKWYWETFVQVNGNDLFGIVTIDNYNIINNGQFPGSDASGYGLYNQTGYYYNGSLVGGISNLPSGPVANTTVMYALDMDSGKLWWGINGTWGGVGGTGNPATGANACISSGLTGKTWVASSNSGNTGGFGPGIHVHNFGQRSWAYAAPAGFKALVDTNLPAPVVAKPNTVMDVLVFAATNANNTSITGLNFQPDLVWGKSRTNAYSHQLYDSVRGVNKNLKSNTTGAEVTDTVGLTSFDSNGFTAGVDFNVILGSGSSVAWCWDAGTSTVTNTQGSISSQVRANASAGFSIVTYTGNGSGSATVGHGGLVGLDKGLIIVKDRNTGIGRQWNVYHGSLGATQYLSLNNTNAIYTNAGAWNNTSPTSTVFTVGTYENEAANYVAYCFAPVAGYSAMGSFVGSSDLPFIYTGFKPRWLLLKNAGASGDDWALLDSARNTYNELNSKLWPNTSAAEATLSGNNSVDFLANGFKMRSTNNATNSVGNTMIYACFAESPFQYARAR